MLKSAKNVTKAAPEVAFSRRSAGPKVFLPAFIIKVTNFKCDLHRTSVDVG